MARLVMVSNTTNMYPYKSSIFYIFHLTFKDLMPKYTVLIYMIGVDILAETSLYVNFLRSGIFIVQFCGIHMS